MSLGECDGPGEEKSAGQRRIRRKNGSVHLVQHFCRQSKRAEQVPDNGNDDLGGLGMGTSDLESLILLV